MTEQKRSVVFISHRKTDEQVAQFIRRFLIAVGVNDDEIFCSSIPGNDVDEKIDIEVKNKLKQSAVILLLLSEEFYKSPYCLNEAGIAWYLDDVASVIPIALGNVAEKDMAGFLDSNYKLRWLTNIKDILHIYDIIWKKLELPPKDTVSIQNEAEHLSNSYSMLVGDPTNNRESLEKTHKRDIIKATEIGKRFLQEFERPISEIRKIPREKLGAEPWLKYKSYEVVLASKDMTSFSDSESVGYGRYELYDINSDGLLFWDYFEGEQEKRIKQGEEIVTVKVRPLNCLLFEDIISWNMDGNEYYRMPIIFHDHAIGEYQFGKRVYLNERLHWIITEDKIIEDKEKV